MTFGRGAFYNQFEGQVNKLIVFLVSSLAVPAMLSVAAFGGEIMGVTGGEYGGLILLETGDGKNEVLYVSEQAELRNFFGLGQIYRGERLRAGYTKQDGVMVAHMLELPPIVDIEAGLDISTEEIIRLVGSAGEYLLVDARPRDAYEAWHIPTAVPLAAFAGGPPRKKDLLIVFYPEDERDGSALRKAQKAIKAGYTNVRVYGYGLRDWMRGNYVVTTVKYLKKRIKSGRPLWVVDVRGEEKAAMGRIPGALSVSLDVPEFKSPSVKEPAVFYGDDAGDERAREAAKTVAARRWDGGCMPIMELEGGFEAWRAGKGKVANGPVETSVPARAEWGMIGPGEFREMWRDGGGGKVFLNVSVIEGATGEFVKWIPISQLPFRVSELPANREIIVYCILGHGAKIAYHLLSNKGLKVRYLNARPGINPDGTLLMLSD